jgi:hypothetical protein
MSIRRALTRARTMAHADRAALGLVLILTVIAAVPQAPERSGWLSSALVVLGTAALHERVRIEFGPPLALLTSLLLFAATPLWWFAFSVASPQITGAFAAVAMVCAAAARLSERKSVTTTAVVLAGPLAAVAGVGLVSSGRPLWQHWTDPLLSSAQGLLSWTPLAYCAAAGLALYARRRPLIAAASLGALAVASALAAARGGSEPVIGSLLPAVPLLAPGLAALVSFARAYPAVSVVPLVGAALLWNYWLMAQYTIGLLPKDEPVRFAAMVRQQADVLTSPPYLYPFSFPANVWFALRHDVPVDRYDLLALEPMRPAVDVVLDRAADRFLLEGWEAPGADPAEPSRWIGERRATLLVPLHVDEGQDLRLLVRARTRFEEPVVEAELGVEINDREIGRFAPSAVAPSEAEFQLPAEVVGRLMRAGYNRITFVSHGVRRIDLADTRPPGPIASRLGSRAWPVAIYRVRIEPARR